MIWRTVSRLVDEVIPPDHGMTSSTLRDKVHRIKLLLKYVVYMENNPHFVKLQQIVAYAKNEDTSVYRDESTFRKITQELA